MTALLRILLVVFADEVSPLGLQELLIGRRVKEVPNEQGSQRSDGACERSEAKE